MSVWPQYRREQVVSSSHKNWEPPDLRLYTENRRRFPAEQLVPYHGKFVAWSPDGTRILASGAERKEVWQQLEEAGLDPSQVVNDYIDPPEEGAEE
jgi:hypothetical protein